MNQRERVQRLFERVYAATVDGDLRWEQAASYVFRTSKSGAELRVESVDRDGQSPYGFSIVDPGTGEVIDTIKSGSVGTAAAGSPAREQIRTTNKMLRDLYDTARGQALGFDALLESLESDLGVTDDQ